MVKKSPELGAVIPVHEVVAPGATSGRRPICHQPSTTWSFLLLQSMRDHFTGQLLRRATAC
jgi:hypothetical protein